MDSLAAAQTFAVTKNPPRTAALIIMEVLKFIWIGIVEHASANYKASLERLGAGERQTKHPAQTR